MRCFAETVYKVCRRVACLPDWNSHQLIDLKVHSGTAQTVLRVVPVVRAKSHLMLPAAKPMPSRAKQGCGREAPRLRNPPTDDKSPHLSLAEVLTYPVPRYSMYRYVVFSARRERDGWLRNSSAARRSSTRVRCEKSNQLPAWTDKLGVRPLFSGSCLISVPCSRRRAEALVVYDESSLRFG